MPIKKYWVIFLSIYIYCHADMHVSIDEKVTTQQDDADKGKKKIGKEVRIPHNKQLVAYNTLGAARLPRMNDFVIVPIAYTDSQGAQQTKMIWGQVMGRNHYVFVVKISKNKGLYYTEYNMYTLV